MSLSKAQVGLIAASLADPSARARSRDKEAPEESRHKQPVYVSNMGHDQFPEGVGPLWNRARASNDMVPQDSLGENYGRTSLAKCQPSPRSMYTPKTEPLLAIVLERCRKPSV